jgi:hypothetical protein
MSNHTKGPWEAVNVDCVGPWFTYNSDGVQVIESGWEIRGPRTLGNNEWTAFTEADARLMALAPEMYDALKMLPLDTLSRNPTPDDYAKLLNAMRAARDVLAKLN